MNRFGQCAGGPAGLWPIASYPAAAGAAALACIPDPPSFAQQLSDKALHFSAFGGLTILAALAHPKLRPIIVFLGLAELGLGIELLQSAPAIGWNLEGLDLLITVLAVGSTLIFIGLAKTLASLMQQAAIDA